jgi:hypothetical protein
VTRLTSPLRRPSLRVSAAEAERSPGKNAESRADPVAFTHAARGMPGFAADGQPGRTDRAAYTNRGRLCRPPTRRCRPSRRTPGRTRLRARWMPSAVAMKPSQVPARLS